MSEFSDSIHIFNTPVSEIRKVLEDLKIPSIILGSNGVCTSVLMGWDDKVKIHTKFPLLDYAYAGDHGLWLGFYNKEAIATIQLVWDDPAMYGDKPDEVPKPVISRDYEKKLVEHSIISGEKGIELKEIIDSFDPQNWETWESLPDDLGRVLQLFAYRWLSFEGFEYNLEAYKEEYPDLILCNMGDLSPDN